MTSPRYRTIASTPQAEIDKMPAARRARIAAGLGTGDSSPDNNKPLSQCDNGAEEAAKSKLANKP